MKFPSRMSSKTVQTLRNKIQMRLAIAQVDLSSLQGKCKHPNVFKVAKSNCGYDYEHYWYVFDCPDCHKHWTVDQ